MPRVIEAKPKYNGEPWEDRSLTRWEVRQQLPEVGDVLTRIPTLPDKVRAPEPAKCTVTYVNKDHMYFLVVFENGFRECYKVPGILQ